MEDPRDAKKSAQHPELTEPTISVPLRENRSDQTVRVGSELPEQEQRQLVNFLQENADVFAWSPADMPGVDPEVAQHYLNISPGVRL
ncbi:unnamed protein product, partial [Musa textilis]